MGRHTLMKRIGEVLSFPFALTSCILCCGCFSFKEEQLFADIAMLELPANIIGLNKNDILPADAARTVINRILTHCPSGIDKQTILFFREQIDDGFSGMFAVWLEDAKAVSYVIVNYFPEETDVCSFGYRYYSFLASEENGCFEFSEGYPITLGDRR